MTSSCWRSFVFSVDLTRFSVAVTCFKDMVPDNSPGNGLQGDMTWPIARKLRLITNAVVTRRWCKPIPTAPEAFAPNLFPGVLQCTWLSPVIIYNYVRYCWMRHIHTWHLKWQHNRWYTGELGPGSWGPQTLAMFDVTGHRNLQTSLCGLRRFMSPAWIYRRSCAVNNGSCHPHEYSDVAVRFAKFHVTPPE